ncbi:hypothetical protein ABDK00_016850 [Niabella insulamsoli]|uniref:hypothetical protein n=1 Tax=Niabella insulamsoli TaxID=3144874 RepID=UPI0031FBF7AA
MKFNRKIYDVDLNRLMYQLVPVRLRKSRLMALLRSLLSPIGFVYASFMNFKIETERELTITPQVCYLQAFLNDNYDFDLRRIRITAPDYFDTAVFYLVVEDKPITMPLQSEGGAAPVLYRKAESEAQGVDFVVKVPADIILNEQRVRAQVDKYKTPTKTFELKYT